MCSIQVEKAEIRDELRNYMKEKGIETRPTFYPIHTMPMYEKEFAKHPVAEDIAARGINVPSYPALEKSDVEYICNVIKEFYAKQA